MQLHLGVAQEFIQRVQLVGLEVINFLDAGVDQDLEAMNAWRMGNVDRRVFYARAVLGCLGDGIHLGVDGAKAVLLGVAVGRFRLDKSRQPTSVQCGIPAGAPL